MLDRKKRALRVLDYNRGNNRYTPPALGHYPHFYKWDAEFIAIARARFGDIAGSIQELEFLKNAQNQKTGFVPNMVFSPKGRSFDPERWTFSGHISSDYTQPPLLALAITEVYQAFLNAGKKAGARVVLKNFYQCLCRYYRYFISFRENGKGSVLVGNIHPHETGRDSDPTFDQWKSRLPTNGENTNFLICNINCLLDYLGVLKINWSLKKIGWDVEKARSIFWINDVMFNCIYTDNLYLLSSLALILEEKKDYQFFLAKAQAVEREILTAMWSQKNQGFFAKDESGENIPTVSISNLFPIVLPRIRTEQLERILDLMENPRSFATKYPFPSVPVYSPAYDPNFREARIWRGSTWITMNWYLVKRGLLKQAKRLIKAKPALSARMRKIASKVSCQTLKLVDQGYFEFYHPETGKPQRTYIVKNFSWSTLAEDLESVCLPST